MLPHWFTDAIRRVNPSDFGLLELGYKLILYDDGRRCYRQVTGAVFGPTDTWREAQEKARQQGKRRPFAAN